MPTTPRSSLASSASAKQALDKPLSPLALGLHTLMGVFLLVLLLAAAFSAFAGLVLMLKPRAAPAPVFGAVPHAATAAQRPGGALLALIVLGGAVGFTVVLLGVLHVYLHIWMIYLSTLPAHHAARLDASFWPVLHRFPGYAQVRNRYLLALPPVATP